MTRGDAARVLAKISVLWPLDATDDALIASWFEALGDLTLADCLDAVAEHTRRSADWPKPAHVRRIVESYRRSRLDACQDLLRPNHDPPTALVDGRERITRAGDAAWVAESVELRRRVVEGEWDRLRLADYRRSGLSLDAYERARGRTRSARGSVDITARVALAPGRPSDDGMADGRTRS